MRRHGVYVCIVWKSEKFSSLRLWDTFIQPVLGRQQKRRRNEMAWVGHLRPGAKKNDV